MNRNPAHHRILYGAFLFGLAVLAVGVVMGLQSDDAWITAAAIVLQTLGSSIAFPILVSFTYDRLRERWLGDAVWRIFGELADAGIERVYRDREFDPNRENAQTRLSEEFRAHRNGEVRMMGASLRVFFNPLGPFQRDIEQMLGESRGDVVIRALIQRSGSPAIRDRIEAEQPGLPAGQPAQGERDADSSIAAVVRINAAQGDHITMRRFQPAPYCTAVIFPHIAYYSPNLLTAEVPVRLPMILFRAGSHGYQVLSSSFDYLWNHHETVQATP